MALKKKKRSKIKKKTSSFAKIASLTTTSISSALSNYKKKKELDKIKEIRLQKLEEKNQIIKDRKDLKAWEERLNKESNKIKFSDE